MKIFYVIHIKNKLLRTLVDGIRIIANPQEKQEAHITVRGPYNRPYNIAAANEEVHGTIVDVQGIDTFWSEFQNTIYLKIDSQNTHLKKAWKKKTYGTQFNPHLTIYDGPDKEFAKEILAILKQYEKNFFFHFRVDNLEELKSFKKQTNNNFLLNYDFNLLSILLGTKIDFNTIKSLSLDERLEKIRLISQKFKELSQGKSVVKKLDALFIELGLNNKNGLFYFNQKEEWKNIFPYRISRAIEEIRPYAFFSLMKTGFGESSIEGHPKPFNEPFIFFFSNKLFERNEESEVHKKVFSLGNVPLMFVEEESDIIIYNGLHFKDGTVELEKIGNKNNVRNFHFDSLLNGETWKLYYKKHYQGKPRVDDYLLNNIAATRRVLMNRGLTSKIINAVLGRLIFNRYLIDRGVEISQKYIPGRNKYERNLSFLNLIRKREKLYSYFEFFNENFRGELFPITSLERDIVKDVHLKILSDLFEGDNIIEGGVQKSLFHVYDFQIIPIELISNIYERFLGKEKKDANKAFYTPPFLVDYVLSKTVEPYLEEQHNYNCKVLDPSCGSGIFLIETLRKIIEKHLLLNRASSIKDNRFLWKLIKENIYGIDIDPDAIDVAIFSLYITILDYKEPKDISKIKFASLIGSNFFIADFFDLTNNFNPIIKKAKLNFIIGNPPWGRVSSSLYLDYCARKERLKKVEIGLSDKQIAQAFLVRADDFVQHNGICAFVVTSKLLYNTNGKVWRNYFLNNFFIKEVFDLSPVRKSIFDGAIWPSAIIIFKPLSKEKASLDSLFRNHFRHITVKPNRFFKYFKTVVIDKYDYKKVAQSDFMEERGGSDWLWKILLFGNKLDYKFIYRLRNSFNSIYEVLDEFNLETNGGLKLVDGTKRKNSEKLIGYPYLNIAKGEFKQFSTISAANWDKEYVGYLPNLSFFNGPRLLIKKGLNSHFQAISAFTERKMVFTDSVTSIKPIENVTKTVSKEKQIKMLKCISGLINSKLFSYYIFQIGSSIGVDRPRAYFSEIFSFPIVYSDSIVELVEKIELELISSKNIIKTDEQLNRLKEELDELIFDIYNVSIQEKSLIDYAMNVAMPLLMKKDKIYLPVSKASLSDYAHSFIDIYINVIQKVEILKKNDFVIMKFIYNLDDINISDKKKKVEFVNSTLKNHDLNNFINHFSFEEISRELYIKKTIRGYGEDYFYLIKNDDLKSWHYSISYIDAADFENLLSFKNKEIVTEGLGKNLKNKLIS